MELLGDCHGLSIKGPPQTPVWKDWPPVGDSLGGVREL